ncbi:MAG: hypothetical protein E6772_04815 [Dysgonomonas sp.]|nr:hypothetical protein [Dysgonomonas sp.]
MNKRQLTKTFSFSKWFLFFFLAAGLSLTSCGEDYDDDITRLENLIKDNTKIINELKAASDKGHFVESITQEGGNTVIKLTNGSSYTITGSGTATTVTIGDNGNWFIDGVDTGKPSKGADGANGTNGTSGSVVTVEGNTLFIDGKPAGTLGDNGSMANKVVIIYDQATDSYNLNRYDADGNLADTYRLGASQGTIDGNTGIKFMPSYLSPGEAPRIHFPVIVTDTVINHNPDINWTYVWDKTSWEAGQYRNYGIIYSGKGEFRYQFNPHNLSFDAIENIGFVRDTADIQVYSNPNQGLANDSKNWMLFNKKPAFDASKGKNYYDNFQYYAADGNGVLAKDKSYTEGFGILNFRAKDWQYAELNDISQRNVYALRVQGKDGRIIHSDFVPAKFEVILQKDVYMVMKESDNTKPGYTIATAPNTQNYRPFISDDYLNNPQHAYTGEEYKNLSEAQKAAVEANGENQLYFTDGTNTITENDSRIHAQLLYQNDEIDLKELVLNFFNKRMGKNAANEYVLEENGFDDYKLEFEPVDYYNQGVNQTKRYLSVTKDGIAKVRIDSDWWDPSDPMGSTGHTAAIDRTPIVRVKLVAPAEDDYRIIKTAIIKIRIVGKKTESVVNYEKDIEKPLKHIDQFINMDMDAIFIAAGVSKNEFRDIYDFVAVNENPAEPGKSVSVATDAGHAHDLTDRHADVKLHDSFAVTNEFNQLVLTITNTAFSKDHVTYKVKGTYVPKSGKTGPVINVTYNVTITYPKVDNLTKVSMYWDGQTNYAYGRYNENPVQHPNLGATDTYRMEAVLTNFYTGYDEFYAKYNNNAGDPEHPRVTLSFELEDMYNEASDVLPSANTGIKLVQRVNPDDATKTQWVLLLDINSANKATVLSYIYANEANAKNDVDGTPIKVRFVASFNECVDGLYGSCTSRQDDQYKFNKTHAQGTLPYALVNGKLFDKEICDHPHTGSSVTHGDTPPYGAVAPEDGRSIVLEKLDVRFINPVMFEEGTIDPLYDKVVNKVDLTKGFKLIEYLYNSDYFISNPTHASRNSYVIYDLALANEQVTAINSNPATYTFENDGWNPILSDEFVVDRNLVYEITGYKHDDGSDVILGSNEGKFRIVNGELLWQNDGENITREFDIHVKITVNHKWGTSVGLVKVPVKKWKN